MFHTAGILCGSLGVYAKRSEPSGKNGMFFIDGRGNSHSLVRQRNKTVFIHGNILVSTEIFHGDTDAWLGKSQLGSDIRRTHITFTIMKYQNGLEIVFC